MESKADSRKSQTWALSITTDDEQLPVNEGHGLGRTSPQKALQSRHLPRSRQNWT